MDDCWEKHLGHDSHSKFGAQVCAKMNIFQPIIPFFEGGVLANGKCSSFEYERICQDLFTSEEEKGWLRKGNEVFFTDLILNVAFDSPRVKSREKKCKYT